MLRFATWKIVSILTMTVLALLVIVPSLLPPDIRGGALRHLPSWIPVRTIVLGLDLQGGSHVLLEVDCASGHQDRGAESARRRASSAARGENSDLGRHRRPAARHCNCMFPIQVHATGSCRSCSNWRRRSAIRCCADGASQALDVKDMGNGTVQVLVTDAAISDRVRRAVDQSIEVLRRRVDALGTTEPNIQRQGNDRILVEVPGLQNPDKLKEILGTTAKLEFRLVANPDEDPSDYEMLDQTDQPGKLPVEKRSHGAGRRLDGCAARASISAPRSRSSTSASTFAAASVSAKSHRKTSGASSPSCSTARSSRRRAFLGPSPAARDRSPAISPRNRQTILPFCCAPAPCPRS